MARFTAPVPALSVLIVGCAGPAPEAADAGLPPVATIEETDPGFYQDVSWSPDGEQLLVSVLAWGEGPEGYAYRIFEIGPDGTGFAPLTEGPRDRWTSWSPEGRVVFASERDGNDDIWSMDGEGADRIRLTDDPGIDSHPAVSPDGDLIAFVSHRTGEAELWVMRADGSDPRLLFDVDGEPNNPAWSADGRWLAFFTSDPDGPDRIWVVGADGSDARPIAEGVWPSFSADGSSVLYGGADGLYKVEPGEEPELVLADAGFARLSPDGSRLAYVVSDSTRVSVRVARADGSGGEVLLRRPMPDW